MVSKSKEEIAKERERILSLDPRSPEYQAIKKAFISEQPPENLNLRLKNEPLDPLSPDYQARLAELAAHRKAVYDHVKAPPVTQPERMVGDVRGLHPSSDEYQRKKNEFVRTGMIKP